MEVVGTHRHIRGNHPHHQLQGRSLHHLHDRLMGSEDEIEYCCFVEVDDVASKVVDEEDLDGGDGDDDDGGAGGDGDDVAVEEFEEE